MSSANVSKGPGQAQGAKMVQVRRGQFSEDLGRPHGDLAGSGEALQASEQVQCFSWGAAYWGRAENKAPRGPLFPLPCAHQHTPRVAAWVGSSALQAALSVLNGASPRTCRKGSCWAPGAILRVTSRGQGRAGNKLSKDGSSKSSFSAWCWAGWREQGGAEK